MRGGGGVGQPTALPRYDFGVWKKDGSTGGVCAVSNSTKFCNTVNETLEQAVRVREYANKRIPRRTANRGENLPDEKPRYDRSAELQEQFSAYGEIGVLSGAISIRRAGREARGKAGLHPQPAYMIRSLPRSVPRRQSDPKRTTAAETVEKPFPRRMP